MATMVRTVAITVHAAILSSVTKRPATAPVSQAMRVLPATPPVPSGTMAKGVPQSVTVVGVAVGGVTTSMAPASVMGRILVIVASIFQVR